MNAVCLKCDIYIIQTINGNRKIILLHLPDNGGDMVDVVELSDKKQVHAVFFYLF